METKVFKILQNIQTKWINMFSSNNVILEEEFKTLSNQDGTRFVLLMTLPRWTISSYVMWILFLD